MNRIIFKALNDSIMVPTRGTEKQFSTLLVPMPDEERKLTEIIIFTFLYGVAKGFDVKAQCKIFCFGKLWSPYHRDCASQF